MTLDKVRLVEEEIPDCIGNFGLYGLDCELCEWADECIKELQMNVEIEKEIEKEENGFQG